MPYQRTLQKYILPEFEAEAPEGWVRRLREISPILPNLSHLGFRKFEARPDWSESPFNAQPDRPLWAVYVRTPRALATRERAAEFEMHWSEVPLEPEKPFPEGAQVAQRAIVSNYQHFMWHSQGVDVFPMWLLQGEWGGTPMKYTARERRWMDASGIDAIPAPPGAFTPCVFDERAVAKIVERDRLIQAGNRFDELEKMNRPDWKKAEDDAAEMLYRETVLETLEIMAQPAVEYMKSQMGKAEIASAVTSSFLKPAPTGLENTLATWKDVFRSTGKMPMVGMAGARTVQ